MTLEEFFSPAVAPIAGACITAMVGLNGLFIRWLVNSFDGLREDMKENAQAYAKWLSDHENKDQNRHEDNLYRFEKISVALARLGSTNGTYDRDKN